MLINKWETRVVKLSDAIPQSNNPRIISPSALKGLKASIGRFGLVELIVWNEKTKHIVSGHQRYAILMQQGVTEVPMVVVNLSPEDELAASLTMNNVKIEGEFDEPIMELISQVEGSAPDLFQAVRMDELKASLEKNIEQNRGDGVMEGEKKSDDWDTECPCCGNKWMVDGKDILVVKGKT